MNAWYLDPSFLGCLVCLAGMALCLAWLMHLWPWKKRMAEHEAWLRGCPPAREATVDTDNEVKS